MAKENAAARRNRSTNRDALLSVMGRRLWYQMIAERIRDHASQRK
jgi:hypothetical protein